MSEPRRVLLVGASGMVGGAVKRVAMGRTDVRLLALSRREVPLPRGARMEMLIAPVEGWPQAIDAIAPNGVICSLGTTWKAAGEDEEAFRAVDEHLVLDVARAARAAGADHFAFVSSVGADMGSRTMYLRVKGEVELALARMGFRRLDLLRPGLLRGHRDGDLRPLERLASVISPLTDMVLQGERRKYRSIPAEVVAQAALQAMVEKPAGRFTHDYDGILRLARRFVGEP